MDEKITIIEGPPPTFEVVPDGWVLGLNESPYLADMVVTHLRTFNGPALVERCNRAWRHNQSIYLEYRSSEGMKHEAPIVAARTVETDDGHMLILWLRMEDEEVELELGFGDDFDDDTDDDFGYPDI